MRKLSSVLLILLMVLTLTACGDNTATKASEQSKLSMANNDFAAAVNYLKLAQTEGSNAPEVKELLPILETYLSAKEKFDQNNIDAALGELKKIPDNYKSYAAAAAIDKLKDNIEEKRSSQINELKAALDSAQTKIKEAESKEPEVVYIQDSSSNNVIDTYYVVNCNEWITLRSAPSTSASSLAHIPLGQAVGFIENAGNGFYKINYDGLVGYGLATYLSPNRQEGATSVRRAQIVNCNEWITLRSAPSTSASALDHIPLGAYVTYIGPSSNGFYCIEYRGVRGYGLQAYIELR